MHGRAAPCPDVGGESSGPSKGKEPAAVTTLPDPAVIAKPRAGEGREDAVAGKSATQADKVMDVCSELVPGTAATDGAVFRVASQATYATTYLNDLRSMPPPFTWTVRSRG